MRSTWFLLLPLLLFTSCTLIQETEEAAPYPAGASGLPPTFTVVTWNAAKGERSSPLEAAELIRSLSSRLPAPVIALQETTGEMLVIPGQGAHFAKSFRWWWSDTLSGVALLSPVKPLATHTITVSRREFGYTTPKVGLAAVYPVTGRDQSTHQLLMITLHGLNFELTHKGLSAQMAEIRKLIDAFEGPVVVCGDFNTWSTRRLAVVTQALPDFAEAPVTGGRPGTSRVVAIVGGDSELAIDRIFYRGLTLKAPATAVPTPLSDHFPIIARFSLP